MKEFRINSNDAGQRLDKFVQKTVKGIPTSLIYKSVRTKKIKVNRRRAEANQILCEGDIVLMFLSDDLFGEKIGASEYENVKPKLDIVYEDKNIIVCEKPEGMLSHSAQGDGRENGSGDASERNTLVFYIQAYLYKKGEYDPGAENSFAPALCNRLDRNTGGLVTAAKNAQALREMNENIKTRAVSKYYLLAVHGRPKKDADTLHGYLRKNSKTNTAELCDASDFGAKEIITKYRVVDYNREKDLSLLEIDLVTGRTHQIRLHMQSIGCPLLGEGKYGHNESDRKAGYTHQALYSYKLKFSVKSGLFSYLDGREFTASRQNIKFLREFQ